METIEEATEIIKATREGDSGINSSCKDGAEAGFWIYSENRADKIADGLDGYERKRGVKNDSMDFYPSNRTELSLIEMAKSIGLWGKNWS